MDVPLSPVPFAYKQTFFSLLAPNPESVKALWDAGDLDHFPYWARIWPSAIALAKWIIDQEKVFQNQGVLEIGAGIGLPSFAAAFGGANVIASDSNPFAVKLLSKNARHVGVPVLEKQLSWENPLLFPDVNTWICSDIGYDPSAFPVIKSMIQSGLGAGKKIVIAIPFRSVSYPFLHALAPFIATQELHADREENNHTPTIIATLEHR